MSGPLDADGLDGCLFVHRAPPAVARGTREPEVRAPAGPPRRWWIPVVGAGLAGAAVLVVGVLAAGGTPVEAPAAVGTPAATDTVAGATPAATVEPFAAAVEPPAATGATGDRPPGEWTVRFAFDGDVPLDADAAPAWLDGCERLAVTGHTCDLGPPEVNAAVGLRRAETVRDRLVARGLDPARIEVRSAGSSEPIASNETAEGRRANRRATVACQEKPWAP